MKRMNCFPVTAGLLMAVLTAAVSAAPLDPAHVPQGAKWVIHLDYQALSDTALMQEFRENRPEMVKQVRQWLQERYGIDPQQDLQGLTLFSDTYESHTGAAVLLADYDLEKVKSELMSHPGVNATQWQGHTLYTWTPEKHQGDYSRGEGESARDAERARGDARESQGRTMTAVLLDGEKTVFAPTPERAKSVVQLLEGDAPSLEPDAKLIAGVPDGAIFYGAAVELEQIARNDQVFPVLRQHEHIQWIIGERDGQLFEEVVLVAKNEEVAGQMESVLEGLVALGQVWTTGTEHMAQLYENVEIARDGSTVRLDWKGETQEVIAALGEVQERIAQWRAAEQSRRR